MERSMLVYDPSSNTWRYFSGEGMKEKLKVVEEKLNSFIDEKLKTTGFCYSDEVYAEFQRMMGIKERDCDEWTYVLTRINEE